MNILVLEDRPYTLKNIIDVLESEGHTVFACNSIYLANEEYHAKKSIIDAIIIDLEMTSDGLTESEIEESNHGTLSGWIWYSNYVLCNNSSVSCIIFSGFLPYLREYLHAQNKSNLLDNCITIHKGGLDSLEELARAVLRLSVTPIITEGEKKSVFLSYCNLDSDIVDIVEKGLFNHFEDSINVSRYTRDVSYRDSFRSFMNTIKNHDYVISIVSSNYLKSHACMYEVGEIINIPNFQSKLIFIVLSNDDKQFYRVEPSQSIAANVYNPISRNEHILFWKEKYENLRECHKALGDFVINSDLDNALFETKKILDNDIQQFLIYISDARGITFSELYNTDFRQIIDILEK